MRDVLPAVADRAAGRFDQADDAARGRRFAAARFSDEAVDLAFFEVETDAVDGVNDTFAAHDAPAFETDLAEERAVEVETLFEIFD